MALWLELVVVQAFGRDPRGVIDLFEVVILGGEPENGNGVDSLPREFGRKTRGSDRFVDAVGGAAEEAHLLAGDDGDRTVCEAVEIFERGVG